MQRVELAEAANRLGRFLVSDDLRRELAEPVQVERVRAALLEVAVGSACDERRTLGIETGDGQRPRHQTLREGRFVAER